MIKNFLNRSQIILLPPLEEALFWIVDLEGIEENEVCDAKNFLDKESLDRSKRFFFKEDEARSIITHAILRCHIGNFLQQKPSAIKILLSDLGKPYLQNYPLHFNLAHKKSYAFLGLHPFYPIGVDIENIQYYPELFKLTDLLVHSSEKEKFINNISNPLDRLDRLISLWCVKEAFLKATGTGFSVDRLPIFNVFTHLPSDVDIYTSLGSDVYIYNKKIIGHKLAVCILVDL